MAGRSKGISWGKAGGDAKEEVALVTKGPFSLVQSWGQFSALAPEQNLPGSGSEGAI